MEEKKSRIFVLLGYIYVILPILIFIIGFCRLPIAIAGTLIVGLSTYFMFKDCPKLWIPQNKKEWGLLALVLGITIVWVCYSGIGAISFQNSDHECRNPLFEMLVTSDWPVKIMDGKAILSYYIGFWLPPAIIGKLFNSITIGYYAQIVWAVMGIFLTFYYVASIFKKKILLPVIIFILFSGMDVLGALIMNRLNPFYHLPNPLDPFLHLEWWYLGYQFSSFTTQLYWVFNQAIPAWIITMLLYHQKNNRSMVLLYSCMFICSTLPAIGILPILAYWCLKNGEEGSLKNIIMPKHICDAFKSGFSVQNVFGGLFITAVSYLYLSNNVSGNVSSSSYTTMSITHFVVWFIFFFMLEAGFYIMCTWKQNKKDPLFYIMIACFLIYPFHRIGLYPDFCMRATIPALVLLYLYVVGVFYDKDSSNKFITLILTITLLIGSVTPIHEITRSVYYTSLGFTKVKPDLSFDNFFAWTEGNRFAKYIARK